MSTRAPAQMFYMKQAAYRARKKKKDNVESAEKKATKKIKASLSYIRDTNIHAVIVKSQVPNK